VSQRTADGYRKFVYQGPDMLALQMERDESEATVAHYTMGAGLEAMRRDSASSFYHYNHLGTTLALTGADEAVTDTYRHDAWGVLLESTGSTVNPHTYVGRERYYRMPNAAMYHLGFRDYAQGLGRFVTVDAPTRRPPVRGTGGGGDAPAPPPVPTHDGRSLYEWIQLLDAPELDTRIAAANALGAMGEDAVPAIGPLNRARLHDAHESTQRQAALALCKLLTGANRAATTIRQVVSGQPQTIHVDSTAGFGDGDEYWYHDVQPGDEVVVHARASLSRTAADTYRVEANAAVTIEAQGTVFWRIGDGEWRAAQGAVPADAEVRIGIR
jgi:hypothetical protein